MATNNSANMSMTVGSGNELNRPQQPAFLAYQSATQSNKTGNGTWYQLICDTELFDYGSDYNNSTGVFTAPITGRYVFFSRVCLAGCSAVTGCLASVYNTTAGFRRQTGYFRTASNGNANPESMAVFELTAGDTVIAEAYAVGEASDTVDIYSNGTTPYTAFGGYLAS